MGFAKLFNLKQRFSLKIAAQVTETWRKLQQRRKGTNNKCALLPTLQGMGSSSATPISVPWEPLKARLGVLVTLEV